MKTCLRMFASFWDSHDLESLGSAEINVFHQTFKVFVNIQPDGVN